MWTKTDEEKRLCETWLLDPLINPETGYPIERNGPTWKEWGMRCKRIGLSGRPKATREMTWQKCQEWYRDQTVNPDSGCKIKVGGPTWKRIQRQCKGMEKTIDLPGDYYIPDKLGMVPTVKWRGHYYVIRKHNGHKIWGPLNKPAKGVTLTYYTNTWDFNHNHYRPIFRQGPPRPPSGVIPRSHTRTDTHSRQVDPGIILNSRPTDRSNSPKYVVDDIIDMFILKNDKH